jgi:5S rRNA maturation endonuclease (ribonuclease M5)
LYVNSESGLYECKRCQVRGNLKTLYKHFGDEYPDEKQSLLPPRRGAVLEAATTLTEEMLLNNDDVLLYLIGEKRGLKAQTVLDRRIGYTARNWSLIHSLEHFRQEDIASAGIAQGRGDFFDHDIIIPYIENGRVVSVRGKNVSTGKYRTCTGDSVRLYNSDSLKGADDVIVVEGEFDCMILEQLLKSSGDSKLESIAVVGIPGASAFPEDFDRKLESAKRIFIGTDPDEPGRKAAEKLKERIGGRARVIEWPAEIVERAFSDGLQLKDLDWSTWIATYGATWQDIALVLKEASGGRLQSIAEAARQFRARPISGGLSLGFPSLDALIRPGLLPGQVLVALAKTGVGKTLWLCNVANSLIDHRVLFVTLEMTSSEIYERMCRIYRFYHPNATDYEIDEAFSGFLICDENKLTEKDMALLVDEYIATVGEGPELIIVDYLGYYARGVAGNSPYEKTSNAIMQLKAEAKRHRCVVISPHQVNRVAREGRAIEMSDARDSGVVEETADFVLSIYRPDDAMDLNDANAQPTGKLQIGILKSRHGNKDRKVGMQMGLLSLVILEDGDRFAKQARDECVDAFRGVSYEHNLMIRQLPKQQTLIGGTI